MGRRHIGRIERRRRIHRTLIWVIIGTLPFYFCGIIILVGFSGDDGDDFDRTPTITATLEPGVTPSLTSPATSPAPPSLTFTPGGPTLTLQFTPTQFAIPSQSATPSNTPTPTDTPQPTETPPPSATPDLAMSATVEFLLTQAWLTQNAPPTNTPTDTPTNTPTATLTLTPTLTPTTEPAPGNGGGTGGGNP